MNVTDATSTNATDVGSITTLVIGTATVYTTFATLALAAFASASKTLRKMVSKYTALAVCIHLSVAVMMLAAQVPLSAELTRLANNDIDINDVEARLASAGLTYGSITMLFSVFLVYTPLPEHKRKVTATAGAITCCDKVRVGFSHDSLREFLAQFLSPRAKRVCMRVYLVVFLIQGLSAWSLQKAVEIYYQSIQAEHLMSKDDIVLLRISVVAFYVVICQVFLIAFFTPMADVRENDRFLVQKGFTALLALKSGSQPVGPAPKNAPNDKDQLLPAAYKALSQLDNSLGMLRNVDDPLDMLRKLRELFASSIIDSQGSDGVQASNGCNRLKLNPKRYVGIYLFGLCLCSLGCWLYVLWEAGVQIGVLDDLEAIRRALVVVAVVLVLLLASVQWVWHACFTIVLLNVLVVTYLFTLPFCSDDANASLEAHPVLTWSLLALYAFELGALLPLLLVFAVIVSLHVRIRTFDMYVTPSTMIRALLQLNKGPLSTPVAPFNGPDQRAPSTWPLSKQLSVVGEQLKASARALERIPDVVSERRLRVSGAPTFFSKEQALLNVCFTAAGIASAKTEAEEAEATAAAATTAAAEAEAAEADTQAIAATRIQAKVRGKSVRKSVASARPAGAPPKPAPKLLATEPGDGAEEEDQAAVFAAVYEPQSDCSAIAQSAGSVGSSEEMLRSATNKKKGMPVKTQQQQYDQDPGITRKRRANRFSSIEAPGPPAQLVEAKSIDALYEHQDALIARLGDAAQEASLARSRMAFQSLGVRRPLENLYFDPGFESAMQEVRAQIVLSYLVRPVVRAGRTAMEAAIELAYVAEVILKLKEKKLARRSLCSLGALALYPAGLFLMLNVTGMW